MKKDRKISVLNIFGNEKEIKDSNGKLHEFLESLIKAGVASRVFPSEIKVDFSKRPKFDLNREWEILKFYKLG